jgi:hypothetical protein
MRDRRTAASCTVVRDVPSRAFLGVSPATDAVTETYTLDQNDLSPPSPTTNWWCRRNLEEPAVRAVSLLAVYRLVNPAGPYHLHLPGSGDNALPMAGVPT